MQCLGAYKEIAVSYQLCSLNRIAHSPVKAPWQKTPPIMLVPQKDYLVGLGVLHDRGQIVHAPISGSSGDHYIRLFNETLRSRYFQPGLVTFDRLLICHWESVSQVSGASIGSYCLPPGRLIHPPSCIGLVFKSLFSGHLKITRNVVDRLYI